MSKKVIMILFFIFALINTFTFLNLESWNFIFNTKSKMENTQAVPLKIHFMSWEYFPAEVLNKFSQRYPGIEVDFEQIDKENYPRMLNGTIASGEDIDIFAVMENDYDKLVKKGVLLDLSKSSFLGNYNTDARASLRSMSDESGEYAVAYKSYIYGIWYNKILFDNYNLQVPRNYSDFLNVCSVLKKNGISPMILGARDNWAGYYIYFLRLFNAIGNSNQLAYDLRNGNIKWTDNDMAQVFKDTESFINNGYLNEDSINLTSQQAFSEFANGKAAMTITPDWAINMSSENLENICEPGVFSIPYGCNSDKINVPGNKAGFLIGVYSGSKKTKEAIQFLDFISQSNIAEIYSENTLSATNVKGTNPGILKYYDLWEPIRNNDIISPGINLVSFGMQKKLNETVKELITNTKDYRQVQEELQAAQNEASKAEQ